MAQDRVTKRVYRWEASWASWNTASLKLPEVRELVRKALKEYGLDPIPVHQRPGKSNTEYQIWTDDTRTIGFNRHHKNAAIALHEAAHHICDTLCGDLSEHSKEWLGIYLWLMRKFKVAPRVALEASAKAMGLEWSRRVSPKRLKKAA